MSDCKEIKPRLAAFLHGEAEETDSIQAHLESCPECRSTLELHRKVSRLTTTVTDIVPSADAWSRVEGRLSTYSPGRLYAIIPAAAAACFAIIVYLFISVGNDTEAIGTLLKKLGPVRIKPFASDAWVDSEESQGIGIGDLLQTGSDGAAQINLGDHGQMIMGSDCEFGLKNHVDNALVLEIFKGRACISATDNVKIIACGFEIDGCSCEMVTEIEQGNLSIYVKSGCLCCRKGQDVVELKAMQKIIVGDDGKVVCVPIEDAAIFEWADKLLAIIVEEDK